VIPKAAEITLNAIDIVNRISAFTAKKKKMRFNHVMRGTPLVEA